MTLRLRRAIAAEHANERGAALAYRGHADAFGDRPEAMAIRRIEAEEWHHRARLAALLEALGGRPWHWREPVMAAIGWMIGVACHVSGWLIPMLGAGLIERSNIAVYRRLVRLAQEAGRPDVARELADLGQIEVDHATWFLEHVRDHRVGRWLPRWLTVLTPAEAAAFLPERSEAPHDLPPPGVARPNG